MKRSSLTVLILPWMLITCLVTVFTCSNPYSTALKASDDVAQGIHQANTATDEIRRQGLISSVEEKEVLDYLHFANTLNGQFQTCAKAVHDGGNKTAGYLGCAKTFSTGLKDPQELSAIRIVSPQGQARVQSIIIAFQGIVDTLVRTFGGN